MDRGIADAECAEDTCSASDCRRYVVELEVDEYVEPHTGERGHRLRTGGGEQLQADFRNREVFNKWSGHAERRHEIVEVERKREVRAGFCLVSVGDVPRHVVGLISREPARRGSARAAVSATTASRASRVTRSPANGSRANGSRANGSRANGSRAPGSCVRGSAPEHARP